MRKRIADIVVETLIDLGVERNFCVVGGGAMHLNNAFEKNKNIRTTFCHHEQACAFAAEGYAKLTGKIAAVSVTSGPGGANTLNGVYSAWVDSTPMIVIAGHPRSDTTVNACGLNLRCRGVQELDIIPMVKGITKYAVMLDDPYTVKKVITEAYNAAMTGRRGPAWVSVPLDIQAKTIEENECVNCETAIKNECITSSKEFDSIINLLSESHRPVILTGTGIRYADVYEGFCELAKKLSIPIVGGSLLSDILYEGFPLYYGLSGSIGPRAGNYILQNSDCILAIGNSLSTRQTGFNVEGFAPNAKIIMVDISEDEMLKPGLNIYLKIVADLKHFIPMFLEYIQKPIKVEKKWIEYCDRIKTFFESFDEPNFQIDNRVPEKVFWKCFREKISNNTILALGNSSGMTGIYQYGLKQSKQRILINYNAGSMGSDLPEAIGAAVATDAPVICVTGDGSIMMNLQELQTIRYNRLPIKIIVFSNDGYGAIRQTCKNFFDGVYTGCDENSGISFPSFKDVANTFGYEYLLCNYCGELEKKIDAFLSSSGNIILEIEQRINDPVIPKIMSKLKPDGTFDTPSFIDLYPFLSDKENETLSSYEDELKQE